MTVQNTLAQLYKKRDQLTEKIKEDTKELCFCYQDIGYAQAKRGM